MRYVQSLQSLQYLTLLQYFYNSFTLLLYPLLLTEGYLYLNLISSGWFRHQQGTSRLWAATLFFCPIVSLSEVLSMTMYEIEMLLSLGLCDILKYTKTTIASGIRIKIHF